MVNNILMIIIIVLLSSDNQNLKANANAQNLISFI